MIKQVTAKKPHDCDVCNGTILPGCDYIKETELIAGQHVTYNRHIHCDAVLYAMDSEKPYPTMQKIRSKICEVDCSKCESCAKENVYSCEVIHKKLLNPVMCRQARRSVEQNGGLNGY